MINFMICWIFCDRLYHKQKCFFLRLKNILHERNSLNIFQNNIIQLTYSYGYEFPAKHFTKYSHEANFRYEFASNSKCKSSLEVPNVKTTCCCRKGFILLKFLIKKRSNKYI